MANITLQTPPPAAIHVHADRRATNPSLLQAPAINPTNVEDLVDGIKRLGALGERREPVANSLEREKVTHAKAAAIDSGDLNTLKIKAAQRIKESGWYVTTIEKQLEEQTALLENALRQVTDTTIKLHLLYLMQTDEMVAPLLKVPACYTRRVLTALAGNNPMKLAENAGLAYTATSFAPVQNDARTQYQKEFQAKLGMFVILNKGLQQVTPQEQETAIACFTAALRTGVLKMNMNQPTTQGGSRDVQTVLLGTTNPEAPRQLMINALGEYREKNRIPPNPAFDVQLADALCTTISFISEDARANQGAKMQNKVNRKN